MDETAFTLSIDEIGALMRHEPPLFPPDVGDIRGCFDGAEVGITEMQGDADALRGWRSLQSRGLIDEDGAFVPEFRDFLVYYAALDRGLTAFDFNDLGVWQRSVHGNIEGLVGHIGDPSGLHTFFPAPAEDWDDLMTAIVSEGGVVDASPSGAPPTADEYERVVKVVGYRGFETRWAATQFTIVYASSPWVLGEGDDGLLPLTEEMVAELLATLSGPLSSETGT